MSWFIPLPLLLASVSASTPPGGPCDPEAPFRLGPVDRVATVATVPRVGRPFHRPHDAAEVRVRLRFVVGCDGRAEPASFALVIADDSSYVLGAVAVVQATVFDPALAAGQPVRQIVERTVRWPVPRRAERVEFDCPPGTAAPSREALRSVGAAADGRGSRAPERRAVIMS